MAYVSDEWLEKVRAAMKRRHMSQRALAAEIGMSQASVSQLLRGKQTRSPNVEPISELLGIPTPKENELAQYATGDPLLDEAMQATRRLLELNPKIVRETVAKFHAWIEYIERSEG